MDSYDNIKNDPKSLILLVGKYVKVQLIHNISASGFVHAIDPDEYSIILLEPCGESFQSILLPGHAVLNVLEVEQLTGVKPPTAIYTLTSLDNTNTLEKKHRLISWLKHNHLPVTECEDNIIIGNVMIMPPYNVTNIFSTNITINKQVKDIIERMPEDFEES